MAQFQAAKIAYNAVIENLFYFFFKQKKAFRKEDFFIWYIIKCLL